MRRRRGSRGRQNWWPLVKWLTVAGIFVAIGYAAHQAGSQLARLEVERLEANLQRSLATQRDLEQRNRDLQAERDTARTALAALRQRYDREVPQGEMAQLVARLRERLDAGLTPARMADVVARAEPASRCDGPVVSRRFRIGIGPRGAEDDSTSFAEGMITVRAVAPATATDLNAATTVTFAGLGVEGGSATMTGLPAEASLMLGNTELRLVVGPSGVPGFAAASLTTCRPR